MSFADEIRSQAKSKEEVAQEAVRQEAAEEKQKRHQALENIAVEFEKLKEAVKERIAIDAKSGYSLENGNKVIQGTLYYGDSVGPYKLTRFMNQCCVERTYLPTKRRGGFIRKYELSKKIKFKARYPDLFRHAFDEMIHVLRQDGIEVTFTLFFEYVHSKSSQWRRTHSFPLEQLCTGCQIDEWFEWDPMYCWNLHEQIHCTYKFRF